MANRYGEAALMASRQCNISRLTPLESWENAMHKLYPTSISARKKGAPRGAFLGLCEAGLVRGIPSGSYSSSKDNKDCAVRAAGLLLQGNRTWSISELWAAVANEPGKQHNSQLDVVLALWKNNLILHP